MDEGDNRNLFDSVKRAFFDKPVLVLSRQMLQLPFLGMERFVR